MPITNGSYKNPGWEDGGPPAINATELNAISNTLETGIPNASLNVGDILFTKRTNLGDKYLLCNGDNLTDTKYSQLSPLLKDASLENNWESGFLLPNCPIGYRGFLYANGYYIIVGATSGQTINNVGIYYSTSLSGTWTYKKITNFAINKSILAVPCIKYLNGRYVILYTCNEDSRPVFIEWHILYSTSLSGTWSDTMYNTHSTVGQDYSNANITYGNGTYVIARETLEPSIPSTSTVGYTSSNLSSWAPQGVMQSDGTRNRLFSFDYYNGCFVCQFEKTIRFNDSVTSFVWKQVYANGGLTNTYSKIFYTKDGYYCSFIRKTGNAIYLAYGKDLDSELQYVHTGIETEQSGYSYGCGNYINNQFVLVYKSASEQCSVYFSNSLSEKFSTGRTIQVGTTEPIENNIILTDKEWLMIGASGTNVTFYVRKFGVKVLPEISVETSYPMIRAIQ